MKIFSLLILVGLSACTSTSRPSEPAEDGPIIGTWRWVETSGGKMGLARSPDSEGYAIEVEFSSDGSFEFRLDGVSWAEGTFSTIDQDEGLRVEYTMDGLPEGSKAIGWGSLGDPPGHWVQFDDTGALILDEGCCDRYKHVFQKDS